VRRPTLAVTIEGASTTPAELVAVSGLPRLEAEVIVAHALGRPRSWLLGHRDDALDPQVATACNRLLARRAAGEPVAYLVGERELFGLAFEVTPAVLIPRPETELLVELALAEVALRTRAPSPRVLDLATGCGAVAIAIAAHLPQAEVLASDISRPALAIAARNAARHAVRVEWRQGDWFAPFAGERFDVVVANPPYVASADPHLGEGDVRYEPRLALVGGEDGLAAIRVIVGQADAHLADGGLLLLEHGHDQGDPCRALLHGAGLVEVCTWRDLAGRERVTGGRLPVAREPRPRALTPGDERGIIPE
jgi:release factor glutamine methyltransferase